MNARSPYIKQHKKPVNTTWPRKRAAQSPVKRAAEMTVTRQCSYRGGILDGIQSDFCKSL